MGPSHPQSAIGVDIRGGAEQLGTRRLSISDTVNPDVVFLRNLNSRPVAQVATP